MIRKLAMVKNLRIHIVPVGFEFRRVTEPLIELQADKVYLITYKKKDNATKFLSNIKKELSQNYKHVTIKEIFLDIWNLYNCIEKFREIIFEEKDNHVYINVSTGTKITAIAGMLSCMLWNAEPYYAPIWYKNKKGKTILSQHVENSDMLPVYEIIKPPTKFMKILNLLQQSNDKMMRKSKLIDELEEMKILRMVDEKGMKLSGPAKHSHLRALLNPMELQWKYVTVKASGRRSEVTITEQGENALRIFGCENIDENVN